MEVSFVLINSFLKNWVLTKVTLKFDSAASSGGQGKVTYFM
jgi:hypothetical protein